MIGDGGYIAPSLLLYFLYGLSFFYLGVAIASKDMRESRLTLAEDLVMTIRRTLEEARFEENQKKLDIDFTLGALSNPLRAKQGTRCVECHMPKVSKSAISVASYVGDVRTHIMKLNIDPNANMFFDVEKDGKKHTYAKGFMTLDYACLSCHGSRDKQWAAKGFHKK